MSDQTITDPHHGQGGSFVLNEAGERVLTERTRDSAIDPETGERRPVPEAAPDVGAASRRSTPAGRRSHNAPAPAPEPTPEA